MYVSLGHTLHPWYEKASAWVVENRRNLSWLTTAFALIALMWLLSSRGGWMTLFQATIENKLFLLLAVLLWPINLGMEAWKWQRLSSNVLVELDAKTPYRSWIDIWKEVLVGQTWALLGPFRLADGAGRISATSDSRLKGAAGAKAFAIGAACQGWITWWWAVLALAIAGKPLAAVILGLGMTMISIWASTYFSLFLGLLCGGRYITFACQYLLMLSAWGVLSPTDWMTEGFPKIAALWCAVGSIPWPAELGVREAAAAWMFDGNLPGVIAATFALWILNRAGPAALGLIWVGRAWQVNKNGRID